MSSSSIGFQCSSSLNTGLFSAPGRDLEPFNDSAFTSGQTLASRTSVVSTSGHSSYNYQSPYPTSTGLSATSAQVRESGNDRSLMAGQTMVMIALAHDRHGPRPASMPTGTPAVATSSLPLSGGITTSASAATTTNKCGVAQSFHGHAAAYWEAIDMHTWLNA